MAKLMIGAVLVVFATVLAALSTHADQIIMLGMDITHIAPLVCTLMGIVGGALGWTAIEDQSWFDICDDLERTALNDIKELKDREAQATRDYAWLHCRSKKEG